MERVCTFKQVLLIATTVMVGVWMGIYRGGFAWDEDDPRHQFNYHPLLIYIGFVFLYGNGKQGSDKTSPSTFNVEALSIRGDMVETYKL